MTVESVIFDEAELLERVSGDAELLVEVIGVFLEDCPARVQAIGEAVAHRDPVELRDAAHALKGAAASLSAPRLFAAAQRLEHLGATEEMQASEEVARQVTAEANALVAVLSSRVTAP